MKKIPTQLHTIGCTGGNPKKLALPSGHYSALNDIISTEWQCLYLRCFCFIFVQWEDVVPVYKSGLNLIFWPWS